MKMCYGKKVTGWNSGGTGSASEGETVHYGKVSCAECGSTDTEAHEYHGRTVYIKCFNCGFEQNTSNEKPIF